MKLVKVLKVFLLSTTGFVLLAVGLIYLVSSYRLNRKHDTLPLPKLTLSNDPEIMARGGHIATSLANCTLCHGDDFGGKVYLDAGAVGIVAGPNLTRGVGGVGAQLTDDDWVRAIRHGIRRDGSSMIAMPSETFVHLTENDLTALVSYLKQLPPVDRQMPRSELRFLGRTLLVLGKLPVLTAEKTPAMPLKETINQSPTASYGQYLATISGCRGCHRMNLSGGAVQAPGTPPASNLTPTGIGHWSEADFVRTLRTGQRPSGKALHPMMPWQQTRLMTDDELHAIWLYLRSVPPLPFGTK